jgi:hypothetical protein
MYGDGGQTVPSIQRRFADMVEDSSGDASAWYLLRRCPTIAHPWTSS